MPANWDETDHKVVDRLRTELRPMHYRALWDLCRCGPTWDYGPKTDPAEKLRQHYAEHRNADIVKVQSGYLGLRRWFPIHHQPMLFAPPEVQRITGDCHLSFDAGYELAKREQYLKDWYRDGGTAGRKLRREHAYLFEHHVRDYYRANWPGLYLPPTNEGEWQRPSRDDFRLRLIGNKFYSVDCKTASYAEAGEDVYKIRWMHPETIFIAGVWDPEEQVARVKGIVPGKWLLNVAGYESGDFIRDGDLMSFEVLPVMLNMALHSLCYQEACRQVRTARYRDGAA